MAMPTVNVGCYVPLVYIIDLLLLTACCLPCAQPVQLKLESLLVL